LVTEVETAQTRAIFKGTVSIEIMVSLVLEMDNKYSGARLRLITVYSKAFTQILTEATLIQSNPGRRAVRYRLILLLFYTLFQSSKKELIQRL